MLHFFFNFLTIFYIYIFFSDLLFLSFFLDEILNLDQRAPKPNKFED